MLEHFRRYSKLVPQAGFEKPRGPLQSAGFHSPAALPSPEEENHTQLQFSLAMDAMMQPFEGDFYTSCLEAVLESEQGSDTHMWLWDLRLERFQNRLIDRQNWSLEDGERLAGLKSACVYVWYLNQWGGQSNL